MGMVFFSFFPHFSRSFRLSGVERQFSEPSMAKSSSPSRAPAQFHSQHLLTYTKSLKDRVDNHNHKHNHNHNHNNHNHNLNNTAATTSTTTTTTSTTQHQQHNNNSTTTRTHQQEHNNNTTTAQQQQHRGGRYLDFRGKLAMLV